MSTFHFYDVETDFLFSTQDTNIAIERRKIKKGIENVFS